jgi:hypothetical protein
VCIKTNIAVSWSYYDFFTSYPIALSNGIYKLGVTDSLIVGEIFSDSIDIQLKIPSDI